MTLAILIDMIHSENLHSIDIYRVKSLNQFDCFHDLIYIQKYYMIIKADNYSICSCSQSQYLEFSCRYFFVIMNQFQNDVGFNIGQIHQHWVVSTMRNQLNGQP